MYPWQRLVGWYTVGTSPDSLDLSLHSQLCQSRSNDLILLVMSPSIQSGSQDLPIRLYCGIDSLKDISSTFKLYSSQPESISIEHMIKEATDSLAATSASSIDVYEAKNMVSSLSQLSTKINILTSYLKGIDSGISCLCVDSY